MSSFFQLAGNWLFSLPCELSSAEEFHHPWHQGKGGVTQPEIVHIGSCLPQGFRWRKPQSVILDLLPQQKSVHLNVHLTQDLPRGICILCPSGLAVPEKRIPFRSNSHSQISLASSWQHVSHLMPLQHWRNSIWF